MGRDSIFTCVAGKSIGSFGLSEEQTNSIKKIGEEFSIEDSNRIKELESVTNHDVKSVEYFIKENLKD